MSTSKTPQPAPNVLCTHSVTLSAPMKDVFVTLGTSAGHERVCRLSKMCTKVELHEKDSVSLPLQKSRMAEGVRVRVLESKEPGGEALADHTAVTRQHFLMEETLPFLFGAYKHVVTLRGTLSWDEQEVKRLTSDTEEFDLAAVSKDGRFEALYETVTDSGIIVWKHRRFEVPDGDVRKTKVTERLEIVAPSLIKPIVQWQACKGHKTHMEQYHTLF